MQKHDLPSTPTHAQKIDQELESIYASENGKHTDFTKLDGKPRGRGTRLLIWFTLTLVVLSAVAYGGYRVFTAVVGQSGKTLEMSIEGPAEIVSGQVVSYEFVYHNVGTVPLANLRLKANLPKGFQITSSEPAPTEAPDVWTIGALTAGSDGIVRLKGTWMDSVPSGQTMQLLATYHPANFNSDFQEIITKTLSITSSTMQTEATGPTTATAGTPVEYLFRVKNQGEQAFEQTVLRLTLPETFLISESEPIAAEGGTAVWDLGQLLSQEEKTVRIVGTFASDVHGIQIVHVSSGFMREDTYLEQTTNDIQTDVLGGGLSLRVIVNGSAENQTADPGQTLRLSIDATNGSEQAMDGLAIDLALSPEQALPIDWAKADLDGGVRDGSVIRWSSAKLSGQGLLASAGRQTIDLTLPILSDLSGLSDQFTLLANGSVAHIDGVASTALLSSTPLTIALNSNTKLLSQARYFEEGTPVGQGPLPPVVGQTTQYRLYWTIENSLHALNDVVITATIPPEVTFVGVVQTAIGTVQFDPTKRELRWTIDRLPTSITQATSTIDLSITPTESDLGKFVKLTNAAELTATDAQTQSRIDQGSTVISTELPDDADAEGKGTVMSSTP